MIRSFRKAALKGLVFILLFSFYALPTLANGNEKGVFSIHQFKLSNGLTVILNEDHAKPEVFGLVVVKAGGKNDPSDATGLAHYMEHMLFKGTQTLGTTSWEEEKPHLDRILELYDKLGKTTDAEERKSIQLEINKESLAANEYVIPNELSDLINSMGGTQLNAGTSPDMTVFYNKFPSNQVFRWIDLYAHRFLNPVFRGFQAELEVVYEEKNLYSDQFQTKLIDDFQKSFFKNHPYGQQPLIGTIDHLKNPSLRRMYEFYEKYYVASNMALIISGDFKSEEIQPFLEEKFGALPAGSIPERQTWDENAFIGREFVEAKLTPIKIGILGFRTPNPSHLDHIAMEVCLQMLNNKNQIGLLDKLTIDGKMLAAQALSLPYQDYGAALMLIVPKIVGQKTVDAENLVLTEIAKLGKGEFDEWLLEASKLSMYTSFEQRLESLEGRALLFADAFSNGKNLEDVMSYSDKVMAISRDDIQRVAKEYFGPNYLAFHSKMGFPKKEKIEKPGFQALKAKNSHKSEYANHFEGVKVTEPKFSPINFSTDIAYRSIQPGADLFVVENHLNDIFSLTLQYQVGNHHLRLLEKATELMSLSGTSNRKVDELKAEFAKIGCTYRVWSDNSFTYVKVEGFEKNFEQSLVLLNELLTSLVLDQSKLKIMVDGEKTNRKLERTEPDQVASALFEYMRFGKESANINRPTMSEIKKMKATQLTDVFLKATGYNVKLHYSGKTSADQVQSAIKSGLSFTSNPQAAITPVAREAQQFSENTIFLVNKKKARQSKVFLFANGENYSPAREAYIDAFNEYFGGGFSGLVLQEIREYRSLAYGAGAQFVIPWVMNKPTNFVGFVSTQADKTLIALETFDSLIREMPRKPERVEMIKNYLTLSAQTERPDFRNLSLKVEEWKHKGFTTDPVELKMPAYSKLQWDDIYSYYKAYLKEKPIAIAIVGDKKQIDLKTLQKYGKLIEIKEASLFSK